MTQFDCQCKKLQMFPNHYCASSYRFRKIKFLILYLQNVGHCHRMQVLQLHHSMANVKIYKSNFFTFFIFAKVWPMRKIVTHTQTHTQTHTHTHRLTHRHRNGRARGYRRNLADLPKISARMSTTYPSPWSWWCGFVQRTQSCARCNFMSMSRRNHNRTLPPSTRQKAR